MVGHEDVSLLRIQTLQSPDLNPKPGQGEVGFSPIGDATMSPFTAGVKQTRQAASKSPKNHQQYEKAEDAKLVGKK